MANKIGRLTEIDVRDLWKHEQYDFSNWLAKEENMQLLDDEIEPNLLISSSFEQEYDVDDDDEFFFLLLCCFFNFCWA